MSKWSDRYSQVITAVRRGKLKRPDQAKCQECGAERAHKHHDDYSKPLEVMYLCAKCHRHRHNHILKWGINGRRKGLWKYNLSNLSVGDFVFIPEAINNASSLANRTKRQLLPGSEFKCFSFQDGSIIFRIK